MSDKLDSPHPLIYADQLASFAMGPFTSKFTIAIEDIGLRARVPVATIVMPTAMLHSLAKEIFTSLSELENQELMRNTFASYQEEMKAKV